MYGLKLTILLLSMLTMMAAAIIAPSLPNIANEFQEIPNVEFISKLILSLPALFIAIIAPFAGSYIDRYGKFKLLYISLIGYALSGASGYILNSLFFILVGRIILGVSIGIIMTVNMTLIGDYFKGDERRKFVGYQSAFIGLAGVLFMSLGGLLSSFHWRTPFLIYLFSLLVIPMGLIFFKKDVKFQAQLSDLPSLVFSHKLKLLFPIATCVMLLFYLMPTQLPFLLKSIDIHSPAKVGNTLAVNALGIVCSAFFYSQVKKRFSFLTVAFYALLFIASGYFLTGYLESYLAIIVAVFIAGIGMGLFLSNLNFWTLEISAPEIRGKSMGVLTACLFMGQFLSPIIALPVTSTYGVSFLFQVSILLTLLMSINLIFANKAPD